MFDPGEFYENPVPQEKRNMDIELRTFESRTSYVDVRLLEIGSYWSVQSSAACRVEPFKQNATNFQMLIPSIMHDSSEQLCIDALSFQTKFLKRIIIY